MSKMKFPKFAFVNLILSAALMHPTYGAAQASKETPLDQRFVERLPLLQCIEKKMQPQPAVTGSQESRPKEGLVQAIQFYPAPPPASGAPRMLPPVPQYGLPSHSAQTDPALSIPYDKREEVVQYLKHMTLENAGIFQKCIEYVMKRASRQNEENLYKSMTWFALGYNKKLQLLLNEEAAKQMRQQPAQPKLFEEPPPEALQ